MKKAIKKIKKVTTDDLAMMVARGFGNVDKRFDVVEKDIKGVRSDIFNLGDRFVSYHMFDKLASRVNMLEKKMK